MRVKLTQDWRRFSKGKELVGSAAVEALKEKAGVEAKAASANKETKVDD